jgi:hypothetical protein
MALKLTLDSLDGLDAALQPLYTKTEEGKYRLDAEGLDSIQAALKTANKEAADRRKALEGFKDVDPAEYQRLKSEAEERAVADASRKGEWDKLREQMAAKQTEKDTAHANREKSLLTALESHLIDAQATAAIASAKGIPQLLLPHVKSRVKVIEDNGTFKVQVLGQDGNPMIADAAGTPAGIAHLIESFKADPVFGRAFEGTGASGGGAQQGGNASAKTMPSDDFNKLDPSDRTAFMKAGGKLI